MTFWETDKLPQYGNSITTKITAAPPKPLRLSLDCGSSSLHLSSIRTLGLGTDTLFG